VTIDLSQPSLAILIDCWNTLDQPVSGYDDVMYNIAEFCTTNASMKSVALATYQGDTEIYKDNVWWQNAKNLFNDETKWDHLRRIWKEATYIEPSDTCSVIANMPLRSDQIGFCAWHSTQLMYYCNFVNPEIQNIYICGFAWNECVKYRPLGWMEIAGMNHHKLFHNHINILSKKSCVSGLAASPQPTFDQEPWWKPIGNDIFLLDQTSNLFFY